MMGLRTFAYSALLISFFGWVACQSPSETKGDQLSDKVTSVTKDSVPVIRKKEIHIDSLVLSPPNDGQARPGLSPRIIVEETSLYSAPDVASSIRKKLVFGSPILILSEGSQLVATKEEDQPTGVAEYSRINPWMHIKVDGDTGYIPATTACHYSIVNPESSYSYFLRVNERDEIVVYLFRKGKNILLDTLTVYLGGSDSDVFPDQVSLGGPVGLRGVQETLRINRTDEYCGGGQFTLLVARSFDRLCFLARTGGGGEQCESHSVDAIFPRIKGKDTISPVENSSALKKKAKGIASSQVFLKTEQWTTADYNEETGNCSGKSITSTDSLYRWDGRTMILIP